MNYSVGRPWNLYLRKCYFGESTRMFDSQKNIQSDDIRTNT